MPPGAPSIPAPAPAAVRKPTVIAGGLESIKYEGGKADRFAQAVQRNVNTVHYGARGEEDVYVRTDMKDGNGRVIFKCAEPSVMPGVKQRVTATVTASQLQTQFQLPASVAKVAMDMVNGVDLGNVSEELAVMWGNDCQEASSAVVTDALELSRSEVLAKASRNIARLVEILGSINLKMVFGARSLAQWTSHGVATEAKLESAMTEIAQIVKLSNKSIKPLLEVKKKADDLEKRMNDVAARCQSTSAAATVIADSMKDNPTASGILRGRAASLLATYAQSVGDSELRKLQIQQPLQLIAVVQNVVLTTVPSLLSSITALTTQSVSDSISPTQINETTDMITNATKMLRL